MIETILYLLGFAVFVGIKFALLIWVFK